MAHITSNNGIIIKAILTKAGRQKLSSGVGNFRITKFALADDEIDYSIDGLYGSLDKVPILQPVLQGNLMMRNKLYTDYNVNNGSRILANIILNGGTYTPQETATFGAVPGQSFTLNPATSGASQELYNISLTITGQNPFSQMKYTGNSSVNVDIPITGAKTYSITNATSFSGVVKVLTSQTLVTVNITGMRTGSTERFTFVFPANTSQQPK